MFTYPHGFMKGAAGGGSDLLDSVVSYLSLDETSGTRSDSVTATGNDLTDTNTVGNATGVVSNAADFISANSEYLVKSSPSDVDGGDRDFWVACWMKLDTVAASAIVRLGALNSSSNSSLDWQLYILSSKATIVGVAASTWQFQSATTEGNLSTGTWYYVVAWHDSTANTLNIQVNDGTVDTNSSFTTLTHQAGATSLQIGGGHGTIYMDGKVDETIFGAGYVPTTADRTWLYNSGSGRSYADLQAYSP